MCVCICSPFVAWHQWLFRKTTTLGTLASQAEIGVRVQALAGLAPSVHSWGWLQGSGGITPGKI